VVPSCFSLSTLLLPGISLSALSLSCIVLLLANKALPSALAWSAVPDPEYLEVASTRMTR
jgi:hypothetical protein